MIKHARYGLALLLAAALIGACAGSGDAAPSEGGATTALPVQATPTPQEEPLPATHLGAALRFIPASAATVDFNDWDQIKAQLGVPIPRSMDDHDQMLAYFDAMEQANLAIANGYGIQYIPGQRDVLRWDQADSHWEIAISFGGAEVVYVLALGEEVDLAAFEDVLETHHFVRSERPGAHIYAINGRELIKDRELRRANSHIATTAVLEEERVLVISAFKKRLEEVLDAYQGQQPALADLAHARALVHHLGEPINAFLSAGAAPCLFTEPPSNLYPNQEQAWRDHISAQKQKVAPLATYQGVGVGTYKEAGTPVGRMVFTYATPEQASADLKPRQQLVEDAVTLANEKTYAAIYFKVVDAHVEGRSLIVRTTPVENNAKRLISGSTRGDMIYAMCP